MPEGDDSRMGEGGSSSLRGSWLLRAAALLVGGAVATLAFAAIAQATIESVRSSTAGAVSIDVVVPDAEELPSLAERSEVVGPDGVRLATLHGEVNRDHVAVEDIPEPVWRAVLAAEDRRFFEHDGYDVEGISRAVVSNYQAGAITQGGSTITQQLAKAAVGNEQTLDRKVAELFQAMALEDKYNKKQLLERYLNQVYFGSGAYGIAAAAEEFFATHVADLRVEQAALLAAQIRSPARMNPRDNPERAVDRRNKVLAGMAQKGWLSEERAAQLRELPLGVVPERGNAHREPYIVEAVKQEFFSNPAFGDSREERINRLFTDGLRITTTIDPDLQHQAEEIVRQHFPERDGVTASIATVDPRDGRVLTAAFGRDWDREQFNLALQGRRQPGSAFKPFVMATALEQGLPPDAPVEGENRSTMGHSLLEPDQTWVTRGIHNYGGASYTNLDMTEAMHRSVNTAFAQVGLLVGMDSVQDLTSRLGISERAYVGQSGEVEQNPSIALGGLGRGVSPVEMASAYGAFANNGQHVRPHVIAQVEDRHGNVIYEADPEGEQALDPALAAKMTDVLRGVVTRGTGTAASIPGWRVAGKTGTTQDSRDVWFVGYTPVLSTAVWVGHPSEDVTLHGMSSSRTAAPLWREFMSQALQGREPTGYPEPESRTITADAEEVRVPSVRGTHESEATSRLTATGLVTQTVRTFSSAPVGTIVWQSPDPGATSAFGETVRLGVSVGPEPTPEPTPEPDEPSDDASGDGDQGSDDADSGDGDESADDGDGDDSGDGDTSGDDGGSSDGGGDDADTSGDDGDSEQG